jgi:hypothetical protein
LRPEVLITIIRNFGKPIVLLATCFHARFLLTFFDFLLNFNGLHGVISLKMEPQILQFCVRLWVPLNEWEDSK